MQSKQRGAKKDLEWWGDDGGAGSAQWDFRDAESLGDIFSGIRKEAKGLEGMVVLGIPAGLGTSVTPSCSTWQLRPSWTGEIGRLYPARILRCGLKPGIKYFLLFQQ